MIKQLGLAALLMGLTLSVAPAADDQQSSQSGQQTSLEAWGIGIDASQPGQLKISRVRDGSPAQQSGLRLGDVVSRLNNQEVSSQEALQRQLQQQSSGRPLSLSVRRDGQEQSFTLQAQELGQDRRDQQGRDQQGRDQQGRDQQGRDQQGRDQQGRDQQGYDDERNARDSRDDRRPFSEEGDQRRSEDQGREDRDSQNDRESARDQQRRDQDQRDQQGDREREEEQGDSRDEDRGSTRRSQSYDENRSRESWRDSEEDTVYSGQERAALGVTFSENSRGVRISSVLQGSPAERSGLRRGDELVALDGQEVNSYRDVIRHLNRHEPGQRCEIQYRREGRDRYIAVRLEPREEVFAWSGARSDERNRQRERSSEEWQARESGRDQQRSQDDREDQGARQGGSQERQSFDRDDRSGDQGDRSDEQRNRSEEQRDRASRQNDNRGENAPHDGEGGDFDVPRAENER